MVDLRQREPDDLPRIVLGHERDVLVAEVILELTELVLDVDRDARRRRDLLDELPVEVAQAVAVLGGCLADRHAGVAVRKPVRREGEFRFWNGSNRAPASRT